MDALFLVTALLLAQLSAAQQETLTTFRAEFVTITPGTDPYPAEMTIGSTTGPATERPAHTVRLARPFSIAKYEVPQNLWEAVMGTNPSRWKGPRNSLETISFDEAEEFCRKATELMRAANLIGADEVIRLPTEAEWEYAARAGTSTLYSFGDDQRQLDAYAWHTGNAAGNDPAVGAKMPNPWGLYDMHGCVMEWCADVWHEDYQGAPADGSARKEGGYPTLRVLRGGSWRDPAERLTSSYRRAAEKTTRDATIGFRCVLARE